MAIKKRKPFSSEYVHVDADGLLHVRVPPACVNWPEEFRMRVGPQWIPPRRIMNRELFMQEYVSNGWSDRVYTVEEQAIRIYYKVGEVTSPRNALIVNVTVVEKADTGVGIELTHPEFAFRNLQIFEFLHDLSIGGIPTPARVHRKT